MDLTRSMPAIASGHVKYCINYGSFLRKKLHTQYSTRQYRLLRISLMRSSTLLTPQQDICKMFCVLTTTSDGNVMGASRLCQIFSIRLGCWYHFQLGEADRRSSTTLFFGGSLGTVTLQRHLQRDVISNWMGHAHNRAFGVELKSLGHGYSRYAII